MCSRKLCHRVTRKHNCCCTTFSKLPNTVLGNSVLCSTDCSYSSFSCTQAKPETGKQLTMNARDVEESTSESCSKQSSEDAPELSSQSTDNANDNSLKKLRIVTPNISVPEGESHPNGMYKKNRICTSKYNCLFFIPQNLSEQFLGRFANIYFLSIQIINFLPGLFSFLFFFFAQCFSFQACKFSARRYSCCRFRLF